LIEDKEMSYSQWVQQKESPTGNQIPPPPPPPRMDQDETCSVNEVVGTSSSCSEEMKNGDVEKQTSNKDLEIKIMDVAKETNKEEISSIRNDESEIGVEAEECRILKDTKKEENGACNSERMSGLDEEKSRACSSMNKRNEKNESTIVEKQQRHTGNNASLSRVQEKVVTSPPVSKHTFQQKNHFQHHHVGQVHHLRHIQQQSQYIVRQGVAPHSQIQHYHRGNSNQQHHMFVTNQNQRFQHSMNFHQQQTQISRVIPPPPPPPRQMSHQSFQQQQTQISRVIPPPPPPPPPFMNRSLHHSQIPQQQQVAIVNHAAGIPGQFRQAIVAPQLHHHNAQSPIQIHQQQPHNNLHTRSAGVYMPQVVGHPPVQGGMSLNSNRGVPVILGHPPGSASMNTVGRGRVEIVKNNFNSAQPFGYKQFPIGVQQQPIFLDTQKQQQQQQQQQHHHNFNRQQTLKRAKISQVESQVDSSPWTEHIAPSGIKYYYNSITKESTYVKPAGFVSKTNPNSHVQQEKILLKETVTSGIRKWTEYNDPATNKKYYSDGITTTWEKPDNFDERNINDTNLIQQVEAKPKSKKKISNSNPDKKEILYSSKEEAIAAFKGLLLAKDISPITKWAEVVKICSQDIRWSACKTIGERKQALAEYQTKLKNEQLKTKRQEMKRAKDAFYKLLQDFVPYPKNANFKDIRDRLTKDDRYFAIAEEQTREELFYDFIDELRKREERTKRTKKKNALDAFKSFLKECEENGKLTLTSTWSSFKPSLESNFVIETSKCALLSEDDKQLCFSDYIIELQEIQDEKHRRINNARLRAEKAQRDAYRKLLRQYAKEGLLHTETIWRHIHDFILHEQKDEYQNIFIPVQQQDPDAPREIFHDFRDHLRQIYRKNKSLLNRLLSCKLAKQDFDSTSYEYFSNTLLQSAERLHSDYSSEFRRMLHEEPVSSVLLFYNELKSRSSSKHAASCRSRVDDHNNNNAPQSSEDEGEIVEDGEVREDDP